ncbi:DUF1266 domain-containing protein [Paenibacillus sp. YSY-4.3]
MTDALFLNDPLNDHSVGSLNRLSVLPSHLLDNWMYHHYGIKNSITCDRKLKWLLYEGYRSEFNRLRASLAALPMTERDLYIAALPDSDERKSKLLRVNRLMPFLIPSGIAAYDYALYLAVAQTGVRLGYLAFNEARVFSREIAKLAQGQYESWDEYHLACIAGMQYLSGNDRSQDDDYSTYMHTRMLSRRLSPSRWISWRARL